MPKETPTPSTLATLATMQKAATQLLAAGYQGSNTDLILKKVARNAGFKVRRDTAYFEAGRAATTFCFLVPQVGLATLAYNEATDRFVVLEEGAEAHADKLNAYLCENCQEAPKMKGSTCCKKCQPLADVPAPVKAAPAPVLPCPVPVPTFDLGTLLEGQRLTVHSVPVNIANGWPVERRGMEWPLDRQTFIYDSLMPKRNGNHRGQLKGAAMKVAQYAEGLGITGRVSILVEVAHLEWVNACEARTTSRTTHTLTVWARGKAYRLD